MVVYTYLSPIDLPQPGSLDSPLKQSRDFFWHPLLMLPDGMETVTAYYPQQTTASAGSVAYRRTAVHTRLSTSAGPVKLGLKGTILSIELYTDTYSYIQTEAPVSSAGDFPPKDAFEIEWSEEDYWAVSTNASVFQFDVPRASRMCWEPQENVHSFIRELLTPTMPPPPTFTTALGVKQDFAVKRLPAKRSGEDTYNRELTLFLRQNYNDLDIPPKPFPQAGGSWVPNLSSDGFYFLNWKFQATPVTTP